MFGCCIKKSVIKKKKPNSKISVSFESKLLNFYAILQKEPAKRDRPGILKKKNKVNKAYITKKLKARSNWTLVHNNRYQG